MLSERGYSLALYDLHVPRLRCSFNTLYYIVSCEVSEHFTPVDSFRLLSKLLAPGGTLYCRTTLVPMRYLFPMALKDDVTHVFLYHRKTIGGSPRTWLDAPHDRVKN